MAQFNTHVRMLAHMPGSEKIFHLSKVQRHILVLKIRHLSGSGLAACVGGRGPHHTADTSLASRPLPHFQCYTMHLMLKTWEWPGDEAS